MRRILVRLLLFVIFSLFHAFVFAGEMPPLPEFSPADRVLIFAPHPDDEAIGTAGIIQRALSSTAKVKVVCYTNGDNNEFAFIVYEKRITFRRGEFLHMGQIRARETNLAMHFLGLKKEDVRFMGYPDFGTMSILTKYWDSRKPFKSMLARINKVSYTDAFAVGAPFVGESILNDLKLIIREFEPTKIFVSHPADVNRDHQSLYLFLKISLWDLEGKILMPELYPYLIHVVGWPKPRGHHTNMELNPPKELNKVEWKKLSLTKEEVLKKQKAISFYKSQIECNPPYLFTFARKNELYGDFPQVILRRADNFNDVDWQYIDSENKKAAYGRLGNDLLIRLPVNGYLDKAIGMGINLLGYSYKKNFDQMPKLNISLGVLGMRVKNKRNVVFLPGAKLLRFNKSLILKIPLASLGSPDYIMARIKRTFLKLPLDVISWRIIKVE